LDYAPRILIVDDEPSVRTFFDRVLSEDGYYVDAVGTARQALRALCDRAFEVALVDLSLPDGDGVELMRQMRAEAPFLRIWPPPGSWWEIWWTLPWWQPHSKNQQHRTSYGTQCTDCSNHQAGGVEHNGVAGDVLSGRGLRAPRGQQGSSSQPRVRGD
jgi:response regulator receiver domain-containing protein